MLRQPLDAPSANSKRSAYVVRQIIDEILVEQVLPRCFSKSVIYADSSNKIKDIQQCVFDIQKGTFDQGGPGLRDVSQTLLHSASFKIKPKCAVINHKKQEKVQDEQKVKPIRLHSEVSQQQIENSLIKQRKQQLAQIKSYGRFYPCASSHQLSKKSYREHSSNIYNNQKQLTEKLIQDSIKQFRQKLIFKPYYSQNVEKMHCGRKGDFKGLGKLKQNQYKKYVALTTDYKGFWVHINKSDVSKHVPHYIEVEAEVLQDRTLIQSIKNVENISCEGGAIIQQHANFKQLKIVESESSFTNKIIAKMKSNHHLGWASQDSSRHDQFPSNLSPEIRLTGKTCEPCKVGFHLFQRMKKANSKVTHTKEEPKDHKINIIEQRELKKKNSFSRKDKKDSPRESRSYEVKEGSLASFKKSSNIVLGSWSGLNYLLKDEQKGHKKKVTIDSNYL